jgi:hypothetical protein
MGPVTMTHTTFGHTPTRFRRRDDDSWLVVADGGARGAHAELRLLGVTPEVAGGRLLVEVLLFRRTDLRVDVYDLAGGLVRALDDGRVPPGCRVVAWDGRDDDGKVVEPGLYQVLVRGETEEAAWSVEWVGRGV